MMKPKTSLRNEVTNLGSTDKLSEEEFHFSTTRYHVTERDGVQDDGIVYENAIISGDIEVGKTFTFGVGQKIHPTSKIRTILVHGPGVYEVCTNNSFYMLERAEKSDDGTTAPATPVRKILGEIKDSVRTAL